MSDKTSVVSGHLMALFSALVWGTTFISTKTLLTDFEPVELLFYRFAIGIIALFLLSPHIIKFESLRRELTFMAAGFCGVTLYFLFENIALTYTYASNVGVIVSVAPFFTGMVSHFLTKNDEKLHAGFFIGFALSMAGIFLISFGGVTMHISPIGDILSFGAAIVWAVYSVIIKKIGSFGYNTVQSTRRVFAYGLVFMIPAICFFDFRFGFERLGKLPNLLSLLFLGLCASAVCFVTWNIAVKRLGAVKTSVYIYLVPVITVISSIMFLGEKLTLYSGFGTALTLSGLILSEVRFKKRAERQS